MPSALRALLAGIIDYAGLFPPAQLSLETALRNYAHYRTEPEAWMLGRFVCPAARLAEIAPFADELLAPARPFCFSALGRGGENLASWNAGLRADLEAITAFRSRCAALVRVDLLEVRLPATLLGPGAGDDLDALFEGLSTIGANDVTLFLEIPLSAEWRAAWQRVAAGLRAFNRLDHPHAPAIGLKIRTGGLEPSAFPSSEQVASIVAICRDQGIPLKATAGLHHPIRHFDAAVGCLMHGFLNVFGAGVLAHARGLPEAEIRTIVDDDRSEDFGFTGSRFEWREVFATIEEVNAARSALMTSFGSCSFDEPRDDLRQLGFLPEH